MNKCLSLVHLITICLLPFHMASAQTELPQARIVNLSIDPEQVVVLHLRPGYVSSVRVLEEVSSVVLGDQGAFKADHSEAEPQLVFFKATSAKPAQTNALITTRGGHEISLSLVSQGKSDRSEPVDYVLNCERPRSFLIASAHPVFVVGETKNVATENQPTSPAPEKPGRQEQDLLRAESHAAHFSFFFC
jgi:type IV secretory pathway VirB9-like protein